MLKCPYCERGNPDFSVRCACCSGSLTLLARLQELPDAQFNQALRAARANDLATASNLLGAVLAARPADAEAWALLGTVHARQANKDAFVQARGCWNTALFLRPDQSEARAGLFALDAEEKRETAAEPPL